ncbi:MAG TPA: N-acetyltransferase [Clostridia bacterium]|nr:N-acetyltransferase [Clostridia bacterium]
MKRAQTLEIRLERPEEYRAVEELTREAFWNVHVPGCNEHYLAHILRTHADFLPTLNFVAYKDGLLVGNIMYTRAKVVLGDGAEHVMILFGPVSVLPQYQSQGVGSALIRHSLDEARRQGYKAVFLYGDPKYYCRFGFLPGEHYGIATEQGNFHPALQALELETGALEGISGRLFESAAYNINEADASAFDKTFPPKEKFVTESQREFARLAGLPVPE